MFVVEASKLLIDDQVNELKTLLGLMQLNLKNLQH
jgi:hypothetical protein